MSPKFLGLALWASVLAAVVQPQSLAQTFLPASVPLANRSPYMSAWYNNTHGSSPLPLSWPVFWASQQDHLGWSGKIRVDGVSYEWMSYNLLPPFVGTANVSNIRITPTRSIFTMQAGPVNVTITFFSPVEPSDWVQQSLPFSYVSLEASSLDGQGHHIQVYSDITAEWISGNRFSPVMWSFNTSSRSIFHEVQLQSPQQGEEADEQAQDGIAYYAIGNNPGVTWQIDTDRITRAGFDTQGTLANNVSTAFARMQPIWTVFALAMDLGTIQSTVKPVTWAVGYVRDPSIIYTAPDSTVHRLRPYFVTKYGTNIGAAVDDFLADYDDALERAIAFDQAVIANASAVSSQYADLVSLATRQTLSTLDITISTGSDGNPNASDVRVFMKNLGGSGSTTGRVNPVERIYAALPALLYFNASLLGPLLAPILDAQDGLTSTPYAAQDIGTSYPNVLGTRWPHNQGVEQSGNMLIMLYAHARFSGDGSLLQEHYNLARRWADYLVGNTMSPVNQISADSEDNANLTNLAIKGIIAIKAMAQISHSLGEDSDAHAYDNQATALFEKWQSLALSSDKQHMLGVYDDQASWALMYNVYADRLLGTNTMSQTLLRNQTAFYKILLSAVPNTFGLKLDNTVQWTSTAWLLFTAATVLDDGVRDGLIHSAWARASSNLNQGAFPDQYDVQTGAVLDGAAGAAVGGVFSLLALNLPSKDILTSQNLPRSPNSGADARSGAHHPPGPVGAIAGGVAGGVALAALIAIGGFLLMRRRYRSAITRPGRQPSTFSTRTFLSQSQDSHAPYSDNGVEGGSPREANTVDPPLLDELNTSPNPRAHYGRARHLEDTKTHEVSPHLQLAWADSASISNVQPHSPVMDSSQESLPRGGRQRNSLSSRSVGSGSGERYPRDMLGLRAEMDSLRRAMQEMQEERMAPPPSYYTG